MISVFFNALSCENMRTVPSRRENKNVPPVPSKKKGNGQKRELPVGSWPETGGQNYEGSKHSIWAHVIGQHHLSPVSGRTPTGTSRFSLLWCLPPGFGHILLHFVALHQSIRSDQPGVEQLPGTQIPRLDDVGAGGK